MGIKQLVRKLVFRHKADPVSYIKHLRSIGFSIGEDVSIYAPSKTTIDESYPWMVTIGNHVRIAQGVIILTHDYSWSVLKIAGSGAILGASGKVTIGDNVFIGMNAIILRGVTIGNNVVIGAGSVVTGDCPSDGVYAGNPAKKICDLETFLKKRKDSQLEEARTLAIQYYERYGKKPSKEIFHEYFMLFSSKKDALSESWSTNKMKLCGNYDASLDYICCNPRPFSNYDDFLLYCFDQNSVEKEDTRL